MLFFLDGQARTVSQIAQEVELGQPATSEHLSVMKRSGVLVSKKQSKEVYYHPDRAQIVHYLEALSELLHNCCIQSGIC
jgi:DNA-binding transcriptional ArsR family regulator